MPEKGAQGGGGEAAPAPDPEPKQDSAYYPSCKAARAAGAAPCTKVIPGTAPTWTETETVSPAKRSREPLTPAV